MAFAPPLVGIGLVSSFLHVVFVAFCLRLRFPLPDALRQLAGIDNSCSRVRAVDVNLGQNGIQHFLQTGEMQAQRICCCHAHFVHLFHIPGPNGQQHIVQNSKGRGISPGPWLCLLYKESSYQPVQISSASRKNTRQLFLNAPVLKAVKEVEGYRIKLGSFECSKVRVPYMGRLVVTKTFGQSQQFRLAIHRQCRQIDDLAIGAGFIATNTYLHPVLVAQHGRQQG